LKIRAPRPTLVLAWDNNSVAHRVCEERFRLLRLYHQTVEGHARLVSQIREVTGSRNHVLFEQLMKRSKELRLDVKRENDNLFKHRKEHGC
jgi:hypothetical protein